MISGSDISVASFWIVFSFVTHHLVTTGYCWIGFLYSIHCKTASISLLRPFEAHGDMFFSKISSKLVMSPLVSYGWWLLLLLVYGLALSCFFFFFLVRAALSCLLLPEYRFCALLMLSTTYTQINASDDRSASSIEPKILDVVQMNSIMSDSKPKCLVS